MILTMKEAEKLRTELHQCLEQMNPVSKIDIIIDEKEERITIKRLYPTVVIKEKDNTL